MVNFIGRITFRPLCDGRLIILFSVWVEWLEIYLVVGVMSSRYATPKKYRPDSAPAISPDQWEKAFSYLRKYRYAAHKWRSALSLVPGVGLSTLKRRFRDDNTEITRKGPPPRLGDDVENAIQEFLLAQADVGTLSPSIFSLLRPGKSQRCCSRTPV